MAKIECNVKDSDSDREFTVTVEQSGGNENEQQSKELQRMIKRLAKRVAKILGYNAEEV